MYLIQMQGRVQDPVTGVMWSADPLFGDTGNPQSLSPYSYVLNSPVTLTDPSGFQYVPGDPVGFGSWAYITSQPLYSSFGGSWSQTSQPSSLQSASGAIAAPTSQIGLQGVNTLYVRAFSPYPVFGGGFLGDNRGFSTSLDVTSRISAQVTFDAPSLRILDVTAWSSRSACVGNPCNWLFHTLGWRLEDTENPTALVSPIEGGFRLSISGANPLVPAAPDLDLNLLFRPGRNSVLFGDGFPNAEVFLVTPSGERMMLGTFQTPGGASWGPYFFLPGGGWSPMGTFRAP